MNLKLLEKFDLMNNKKIVIWLNVFSLIIFLCILLGGITFSGGGMFSFNSINLIAWLIIIFIILIIHELIHGLFFKLFKPHSKIKYGFKNGMAYATNPGAIYTKTQFLIIIIMPFFLISILLYVLSLLGIGEFILILLFAMHTGGCVGDFYSSFLLLKRKEEIFIEDTEVGFNIYTKKP